MSNQAWYLRCTKDQIADRVILIGDPARVPRLAENLTDARLLPVNRGLAMATGMFEGTPITLAAFGMGAPIATIVLHELAAIGAGVFLRIGTAMCLPPTEMGSIVLAERAVSFEGTSKAYIFDSTTFDADADLASNIMDVADVAGVRCQSSLFASFDGFYRDMYPLDKATGERVTENFQSLQERGVAAVDMETSALLAAGQFLDCKVSSLCVASVDAAKRVKLPPEEMATAEKKLGEIAFQAIARTQMPKHP